MGVLSESRVDVISRSLRLVSLLNGLIAIAIAIRGPFSCSLLLNSLNKS